MPKKQSRARRFFSMVWSKDVHGLASELSFTFLLTLFPLLVVFVSLLGLLQDPKTINLITDQLGRILPAPIFLPIDKSIENLTNIKNYKILTLSILFSILSSFSIFGAIIKSLRKIVEPDIPINFGQSLWLSLRMMLGSSLLILVYFYISYALFHIEKFFYKTGKISIFRKNPEFFLGIIAIILISSLFSFYYSFSTSKRSSLRDCLPGAFFASILFVALTFGFQYYLKLKTVGVNYSFAYYLLSKMVVLMLYAYVNSTFFLWGFVWNQTRLKKQKQVD
ncbi:YihY/virulence factor BrkB family protein [Leptospira ryugenii]|nr:YhjD/YihY/BrkB family envelope integrity protein [Leptospira ryugenii]